VYTILFFHPSSIDFFLSDRVAEVKGPEGGICCPFLEFLVCSRVVSHWDMPRNLPKGGVDPDQIHKPPQLIPLNTEEHWLYCKLSLDDESSHPTFKAEATNGGS
ncbi:hypothetical protein ATANTOWER_016712, partial [Ataeniobius toweri]|nr:hypothetical protein [Ataeniobius toweri]